MLATCEGDHALIPLKALLDLAHEYIEALSHAIAGAKVVLMPAESTLVNVEQPGAFNRIVLDFLDAINQPPKQ